MKRYPLWGTWHALYFYAGKFHTKLSMPAWCKINPVPREECCLVSHQWFCWVWVHCQPTKALPPLSSSQPPHYFHWLWTSEEHLAVLAFLNDCLAKGQNYRRSWVGAFNIFPQSPTMQPAMGSCFPLSIIVVLPIISDFKKISAG